MVDAQTDLRLTLHILAYFSWQREGTQTFDMQRAALLALLEEWAAAQGAVASPKAETDTLLHLPLLLGNQTIILDDVADIDNAFLSILLQILETQERGISAQIGPFYLHLDTLLASGEAHIRSLLQGKVDAARYDMRPKTVALFPDAYQLNAQLPQILQGFGVNGMLLPVAPSQMPIPYLWRSPDGSAVLIVSNISMEEETSPQDSIEQQQAIQPQGPFLWVNEITKSGDFIGARRIRGDFDLLGGTLTQYVDIVRQSLPDAFRPYFQGELHLDDGTIRSGRYTSHIQHKQHIVNLDALLTHRTEPLLALALVYGEVAYPRIQHTLLGQSWRLLLQNMTTNTYVGAVANAVVDDMATRSRRVENASQRIIDTALTALDGTPIASTSDITTDETYITVWNLHGHAVEQVVTLPLVLPARRYPQILKDSSGQEIAFTWDNDTQTLAFRASVPSVGYAGYTLELSSDKTAAYNQRRAVAGRSIGGASTASLVLVGGRLDWSFDGGSIIDLLRYFDGGDAGDVWHYAEPQPDVVMQGSLVDVVQIEATPTYERLIFRNRMRIAPELKNGGERVRGLRVLDINTTATYHTDIDGLYFKTTFTNTAKDHRLRAYIRTGISAQALYTDSAFGITKRRIIGDDAHPQWQEHPLQNVAALYGKQYGMALFTRGLLSVEPIEEEGQITLALTLLRAVGWVDKANEMASQKAQQEGEDFEAEFLLLPLAKAHNPADLMRRGMAFRAPLQAYQYAIAPKRGTHSFLKIESEQVVLTALKPPQYRSQSRQVEANVSTETKELIVRLLNPTDSDAEAKLIPAQAPTTIEQVSLAETSVADLALTDGYITVTVKPYQLLTLRMIF